MRRIVLLLLGISLALNPSARAHVGEHPSIHDTVAGIVERLRAEKSVKELKKLDDGDVVAFMTEEERRILSEEYLTFNVNVPVVVSIVRHDRNRGEPYWLKERGFERTDSKVKVGRRGFDVWEKKFGKGPVGLGINSVTGRGDHYFVAIRARRKKDTDTLEITSIYPGQHTLGVFAVDALPYSDGGAKIASLSPELEGQILLRGVNGRKRDAKVVGVFRQTDYPSSETPDQILLTWSDDPQTTQTIQWRTSTSVDSGVVAYSRKSGDGGRGEMTEVQAETRPMTLYTLSNDPVIHRHTAILRGLEPGTTYTYTVGDGGEHRSETGEFTTAPDGPAPFSFVYMGDAQNGLDTWSVLAHKSIDERPDTAFYIMAGDLVDRGGERDDWDHLFAGAKGIFDRKQVIAVPGNHEYQGGSPDLYLEEFAFPAGSPLGELNYTVTYGNALFIMLDSNLAAASQTAWLEEQLATTDAVWKFAVYHHPAYSSNPTRNNPQIRKYWTPLFDKYHLDMALQGHDHAYLRTYPMHDEKKAGSTDEGTVYIVSVSGTKHYDQGDFDYTAFGMTNVSTYQVLDIRIDGNKLTYRAYDIDGKLRDEFEIVKE